MNTLRAGERQAMKRIRGLFCGALALSMMYGGPSAAQSSGAGRAEKAATCAGPVYGAKDVSSRAKIIARPEPADPHPAEPEGELMGRVVLRVVLCRTGEVADIEVVEGLPDGLTERAVEAVRQIKFTPAERRGKKVSQRALFEYTFRVRD